mmetsp:Transcript_6443/g.16670  ORF Transcript_6443/g.16670 Transcript_6443/m.16670 type:complete len:273 (+) Transcript_6443:182-1000(+)
MVHLRLVERLAVRVVHPHGALAERVRVTSLPGKQLNLPALVHLLLGGCARHRLEERAVHAAGYANQAPVLRSTVRLVRPVAVPVEQLEVLGGEVVHLRLWYGHANHLTVSEPSVVGAACVASGKADGVVARRVHAIDAHGSLSSRVSRPRGDGELFSREQALLGDDEFVLHVPEAPRAEVHGHLLVSCCRLFLRRECGERPRRFRACDDERGSREQQPASEQRPPHRRTTTTFRLRSTAIRALGGGGTRRRRRRHQTGSGAAAAPWRVMNTT